MATLPELAAPEQIAPGWRQFTTNESGARLMDTFSKLLTGTTFTSYTYENTPPAGDDLVEIVYSPYGNSFVDILRTYADPKTSSYDYYTTNDLLASGTRLPVYDLTGSYTDRGITYTNNLAHITFAPNELRDDQVLLVQEDPTLPQSGTYNQAIQLERGWNLVSWYVQLPDPSGSPRLMNDVFRQWLGGTNYGDYFWLNPSPPDAPPEAGDRVGKYNSDPVNENMYPEGGTSGWTWSMNQAYNLYIDTTYSAAHFWEYEIQPHVTTGAFPIDPSSAWDRLPNEPPNFWWFLAYPLRMSQVIDENRDGHSENPTILALENNAGNRLLVLKDDAGHQFVPGHFNYTNLYFLEPGKGYFAGFEYADPQVICPGFANEMEPASVPGGGSKSETGTEPQTTSLEPAHFTYKERTHWWYPVVIDTATIGEIIPEAGDEIAVFDGDLCVGAAAYPDSFPVILAAWKDDIASPGVVDGYWDGNEMIFVWYDQSANTEITFTPTIGTYSAGDDRIAPTHSGFGCGFYAVRSLTDGAIAGSYLPREFKLGQNFPNPFNAETIIPLELPQRSQVQVELFNIQGQNLGTIYKGIQNSGWQKIRLNASRLPSGIYVYRLTAEGLEQGGRFQDSGKMLVLK